MAEFNRFALAALRTTAKLTKYRLAQIADVSAGTVADLESGRRRPSPDMVLRLADALGVPASALVCPCDGGATLRRPYSRRRSQVPAG